MQKKRYLGIFLGGSYGLIFRILGGLKITQDFYSIYSITFIWLVPILISLTPILFARKEIMNSVLRQFSYPFLSVIAFFALALATRLEDLFCILILGLPFFIAAGITGIIIGQFVKRLSNNNILSLLLLPLLLNPLENLLPSSQETFEIKSKTVINTSRESVWEKIIEVPEIKENEYYPGFYNLMGVPRPIRSKLEEINGINYRIGYFTDGLKLVESISEIDTLNQVTFQIHLDKSQLRDIPMDKHVLQGNYFRFKNITYQLKALSQNKTELTLTCSYKINSKMNFYANFWASDVVEDFETKLLQALKLKIEKQY